MPLAQFKRLLKPFASAQSEDHGSQPKRTVFCLLTNLGESDSQCATTGHAVPVLYLARFVYLQG